MDREAITDHYLTAGREYLEALRRLDLDPEGLMWGVDRDTGEKVLLLITSLYDIAGPLRLSELLFKAYNASATPQAISPFTVEVHSPDQEFTANVSMLGTISLKEQATGKELDLGDLGMTIGPYQIFKRWIYQFKPPKAKRPVLAQRLQRFERKVQALKAA